MCAPSFRWVLTSCLSVREFEKIKEIEASHTFRLLLLQNAVQVYFCNYVLVFGFAFVPCEALSYLCLVLGYLRRGFILGMS